MRKSDLVDHTGLRVDLEVLVKLGAPRLLIFCLTIRILVTGIKRG